MELQCFNLTKVVFWPRNGHFRLFLVFFGLFSLGGGSKKIFGFPIFIICSPLGPKIQEMAHFQHLKWHMAVRRPFILSMYGVSVVLMEYSAHNCRYFDFRPFETLILVILRLFLPLGPKIQEMSHLQHLK